MEDATALHADHSTLISFLETISGAAQDALLISRLKLGGLTVVDYHDLLLRLFPKVYSAAGTLSLAAAHCPPEHSAIRSFLMRLADQEKDRWRALLDDLDRTDFPGPDPRSMLPTPQALSCVGFSHYTATTRPLARLAIAAVEASINRAFRPTALWQRLQPGLKKEQCTFLSGPEAASPEEITGLLSDSRLSVEEWRWVCLTATTSAGLYLDLIEPG